MNYYPVIYAPNLINKIMNRIEIFCSNFYKGNKIMTNEQLTAEIINLREHQTKIDSDYEHVMSLLKELQEDVRTTRNLAEDVHILAINMENIQKSQEQINKKVDALTSKEYTEYTENKKLVKQNLISGVLGAVVTSAIALVGWVITKFIKGG